MKKVQLVLSVVPLLFVLSVPCFANVFSLGQGLTNLETVPVGDPGNAGELSGEGAGGYGPDRVCGAVDYTYSIGRYEVTAGQYCDFLNHVASTDTYGLYNANMASNPYGCGIQQSVTPRGYSYSVAADWANRPVNYVSFWDACRFANWLHNGQPRGFQNASTTEDGAYAIFGYNGTDGREIQRKGNWEWAVTSEDEWYKAAYYKGGGTHAGYWDYPMQSDISSTPSNDVTDPDGGNNANFYQGDFSIGAPYFYSNVGEFENSESAYGTFDQGGNIFEWNEAVVSGGRSLRGGCCNDADSTLYYLRAYSRYSGDSPTYEDDDYGFRVVTSAVPEPASFLIFGSGMLGLAGVVLRRRNC